MDRRQFMLLSAALAGCKETHKSPGTAAARLPFDALDASVAQLAAAMRSGALSAHGLTRFYLDRIARLNQRGPELRAVIETNPEADASALALDRERPAGKVRGPMHGVPVLIKDNIETADRMMTTAGSMALEGWYAPEDAPLVARLRRAGAVILGKTNLSEWANIRSTHSSSGWSARGGQTRNPHDLLRSPSGSSSGSAVAVAANLCAVAIGSETDGSIVSPASVNGLVGIKPTLGLVSRSGIIPIAHSQDTAGPLARTVADAALLLGIISGPDASDAASAAANGRFESDYTRYLAHDGLRNARLGIARNFFADNVPLNRILDDCVSQLRAAGAVIVDPVDLHAAAGPDGAELEVLLYELKADLNRYLSRLPENFRVHTLADIIRFNEAQRTLEMKYFEQELFIQAQAKGPLSDAAYRRARERCLTAARGGIDNVLRKHRLDAIVALTAGPAWMIDHANGDASGGGCSSPAAMAGYPHITVPAARYQDLPIGLSFFASAFSEPVLIKLASGFESIRRPLAPLRL
jgi:amidase